MVKGKIVLITGGTSGIGFKTAELFGAEGSVVYISYHSDDTQADKALKELKEKGCDCHLVKADVSVEKDVNKVIESIIKDHGRIDVLVNNATPKLTLKQFDRLTTDDLDKDLNVIVKGAFYSCKAVVPHMKKNRYGRIINVLSTSIIGKTPSHMSSYVVCKSGLLGLTKALAAELGDFNITVNSVSPGFTETNLIKNIPPTVFEFYKESLPIKRLAAPQDVARVILFLCSSGSDYITGANIPICGGGVM